MLGSRAAPDHQRSAQELLKDLGWAVEELEGQTLQATKLLAGNELRWLLHFEDERSFGQLPAPRDYAHRLLQESGDCHFFDLVATEGVLHTQRWNGEVRPILEHQLTRVRNRHYGSWTALMDRFAAELLEPQLASVEARLKSHFIRTPLPPHFEDGSDYLEFSTRWLRTGGSRIMLVTGDPGAGKSVFALLLTRMLRGRSQQGENPPPVPFLISFSPNRPLMLDELIDLTLKDLGQQSLSREAVKFLLSRGRIVLIFDGFDEYSRALARRAEETVEDLAEQINGKTDGRLVLTSRPAFLATEKVFSDLTEACGEEKPTQRRLALYTDEQIKQWVLQNAPDHPSASPPDRHWQRIQTTFAQDPEIRELCRTPVYLRMLSEILVKDKSVRSRYGMVEQFCEEMWERERERRRLSLTDAQYLFAYQAISAAIVDEKRLDANELLDYLHLYICEYAPQLLAEVPEDADTLLRDLAIGPLTYQGQAQRFEFAHEVLTGYFFARLLARALANEGGKARELLRVLWNRRIYGPAESFLKEAVQREFEQFARQPQAVLEQVSKSERSGLMLWNIARAVGAPLPRDLFKEKDVVGITFGRNGMSLAGVAFDGSRLQDVEFVKCEMEGTTFRGATFGRVSFISCEPRAIFDDPPRLTDDAEVVLVREGASEREVYVGQDISKALAVLSGRPSPLARLPEDLGKQTIVLILRSLFKADGRRLDYPESSKIENRVRASFRSFGLEEQRITEYLRVGLKAFDELVHDGWICKNQNRPRTFLPCATHAELVGQIARTGRIPVHDDYLTSFAAKVEGQLKALH